MQVGDYYYRELLGIGPYANVYAGKDSYGRRVTVKVIPRALIQNVHHLDATLIEELEQLKNVAHDKVLRLIDVLKTELNYYLISEYHCGLTLQDYLNDKNKLTEHEAITLIKDLLEAFTELKNHGIIHRNIKPSNVVKEHDSFKLCDFSHAQILETFNVHHGLDLYKSPQVLKNQYYTSKCDIWSIGILLYHSLYGYTPWFAKDKQDLIHTIQHQKLTFSSQLVQIGYLLQDFITRCLQLEEADRFDWDTIYEHQLVYAHFQDYKQQIQATRIKFLMNHLRRMIIKNQIDLLQLFASLDANHNQSLDFDEFSKLLASCDPQITRDDMEYIFRFVDTDYSGEISFDEFIKWLADNNVNVRLLSQRFQQAYSLRRKNEQQGELTQSIPLSQSMALGNSQSFGLHLASNLQSHISDLLARNHVNTLNLFTSYDQNGDSLLSQREFWTLVKQVDPRIGDEIICQLFEKLDGTRSGQLTFIQFREAFAPQVNQSQMHSSQAGPWQGLSQLRSALSKQNHLDVFQHFDFNKDGLLQQQEFAYLIRSYLPFQAIDTRILFEQFNKGADISFIIFRQVLSV